ncbi:hypothetical protein GCM10007922_38020 [Shewanella decolorationis]|nr:hypothetical protein GCM10007922_38020 [Shewanella decolorationis]
MARYPTAAAVKSSRSVPSVIAQTAGENPLNIAMQNRLNNPTPPFLNHRCNFIKVDLCKGKKIANYHSSRSVNFDKSQLSMHFPITKGTYNINFCITTGTTNKELTNFVSS